MTSQTDLNYATLFAKLQSILSELQREVTQQISALPQLNQPLRSFQSPDGNVTGSLLTFTGEELDWLVYSWFDAAQMKFGTTRLTLWLSPLIQVPHLAFEFGTKPDLFFYIDYIPRVDLWTDLSYTEEYYEPLNATYMALRENPNLSLFVSKALYIRQLQSPTPLCFTCPTTQDSLALIERTAQEMCSRWLTWVKQAAPVPVEHQAALAKRDLLMRKTVAERDPGNAVATQIFGKELADQLIRALWSKDYE
ncbi:MULTISPECIES: red chlorophyll catabolite reductase [Cyanophyceae]|uniref:Red chlorophyll catabolite reductase n=1 Tax=Leptolyngbya subtilissima DQ-A4 TaxID=2933933 RepID=A0ABV0K4W7_9CYAN|nr:red chlorophyll catabolite reductase [Nodosilinea sp. FACHB-141]MBD2112666.1 red chlorophyll catabolite reductase [Nodosilinea sp. FACHB-141]